MPYCPCDFCNGLPPDEPEERYEEERTPLSIYDRLADLSKKLEKAGVQGSLLSELNEITEEVDAIDSEITTLQFEAGRQSKDTTQLQLGIISQKLY